MISGITFLLRSFAFFATFISLTACTNHETFSVPPRSALLGTVRVNGSYTLAQPVQMAALDGGAQPRVDVLYWPQAAAPAEAFAQNAAQNPSTSLDRYGWSPVDLSAGTELQLDSAEVYSNSHVYSGEVLSGPAASVHLLLVIPAKESLVAPPLAQLIIEDKVYLTPADDSSTQPVISK